MYVNKKAFTLIELLAVIVILGILMIIAIPSVTKYINKAKKEAYIKSVAQIVDAIRYGVISEDPKYSLGIKMKRYSF